MSHRVKILACSSSEPLAIEIAKSYGQALGEVEVQKFSDGEFVVLLKKLFVVAMFLLYKVQFLHKKI